MEQSSLKPATPSKLTGLWYGIPEDTIFWNPTINATACIGCGTCVTTCGKQVYRFDFDQKKTVAVNPPHCMVGCTTCGNLCPTQAISFPDPGEVQKALARPEVHQQVEDMLLARAEEIACVELLQQVEMAQATTALWIASLDRLQADHNQAKAVWEAEQAGFGRVQALIERKAASADDLDHATESLRIAEAGLLRADAAMLEGKRQITAAEKTLNYHDARLADTRVVAPFDGLVVKRYRDPGDIGVPGSPILLLVSTHEIWVSAWVDETEMSRLHQDQLARVRIRSDSGRDHDGKVSRLGLEAHREPREFLVDVQVLTLPENRAVGQRAEVFIEVARRTAVPLLPERPLTQNHFEIVVDKTLGFHLHETIKLGKETYKVVGITKGMVSSGGDGMGIVTVNDSQSIQFDTVGEALRLERSARERRSVDDALFLNQPQLVEQFSRPASQLPAVSGPQISAVIAGLTNR